jgi:uncharacterized protein YqgQ
LDTFQIFFCPFLATAFGVAALVRWGGSIPGFANKESVNKSVWRRGLRAGLGAVLVLLIFVAGLMLALFATGSLAIALLEGGVVALGCLLSAFRNLQLKRIEDDVPTSKTLGVFIGFTKLKGTAESETPLRSYLAVIPCVQYGYLVQELCLRWVTETYRDSDGRWKERRRQQQVWVPVASYSESVPFFLKDDKGIIRIVPDGAKIEAANVFHRAVGPGDPLYFGKGPSYEAPDSLHRRSFREDAIPVNSPLLILGQARERQDVVAAEIAYDKQAPEFVISATRSEKQMSCSRSRWFWAFAALGLVGVAGTAALTGQLLLVVLGSVVFLIALLAGWGWIVYNSLINLRNTVQQAWSQVDVQLRRRNDLIPNLVGAVEGYRAYESQIQELLSELRTQATAAPATASPDVKGLAPVLRAVVERLPGLKASGSFLRLQQSLVETEERIALARDYFNDKVMFYNTRLKTIPDSLLAGLAKLRPRDFIGARDFERAPLQVQMAMGPIAAQSGPSSNGVLRTAASASEESPRQQENTAGTTPPPQASDAVTSDKTQKLQRLKKMLDAGLITQQDYDEGRNVMSEELITPDAVTSDKTQKLQRLRKTLDAGLITQQDYDEQRRNAVGTTPPPEASDAWTRDAAQKLQRLKNMLDAGLITQQDYDEARNVMSEELITRDNLSLETLQSALEAASITASVENEYNYFIMAVEADVLFNIRVLKEIEVICLGAAFGFKPSASRLERLECANKMNSYYTMMGAVVSDTNDLLSFGHSILVSRGISRETFIVAVRLFCLSCRDAREKYPGIITDIIKDALSQN